MKQELRESITQLGLEFRLMTQFTSFVAVEEMTVTEGGQPRRIDVPVEMPEGVSYEGVFGDKSPGKSKRSRANVSGGPLYGMNSIPAPAAQAIPTPMQPTAEAVMRKDENKALSAADQKRNQMLSKLHPSIAALVERLKNKQSQLSADEARFVRDGRAEVQVWLTTKSTEVIAQLKRLGFEVTLDPKSSKMIIGRLPIDKLAALAELAVVKYISPQSK